MAEIEKIKVMIKEPGQAAYVTEVERTLEKMQEIVDGNIDRAEMPGADDVDIYFDDECLNKEKPGNVWLAGTDNCIEGTIYMVGYDRKTGENISLADKQIKQCERYVKTFSIPEGMDLYADYRLLLPIMYSKSKKYFKNINWEL